MTRAAREGKLFWATGDPFKDDDRLIKQREDPGCYYLHQNDEKPFPAAIERHGPLSSLSVRKVTATCKLFADAHGWLAHLQDNCLIIRSFPDISPSEAAPRQGEIELYFNPELNYIELENQGAYQALGAGETLTYETNWQFHRIDIISIPEVIEQLSRLTP